MYSEKVDFIQEKRKVDMLTKKVLWQVVVILLLGIPLSCSDYYYYLGFILLTIWTMIGKYICVSNGTSQKICMEHSQGKMSVYPMILILIWIFGIWMGLFRQNPMSYIVRNFAGTVCYSFYYFLAFRRPIKKEIVAECLYAASILATMFTGIAFILKQYQINIWPFSNVIYSQISNNLMSSVEAVCFILEAVCLWRIFGVKATWKKKVKNVILLLTASYALLFTNVMGGFKLGYIAVFGMVIFFAVFYNPQYSKGKKIFGLLLFIAMVVLVLTLDITGKNVIGQIFSPEDAGNSKRFFQIQLVLDRFKFWGNGLGAVFEYTFWGREYSGYSVEVSYLNIIDKYGILSVPVLGVFVYTFICAFAGLRKRDENPEIYIMAIGACGYMFVAIGNPVLFSAYNVMLHSMILYLLTYGKNGVKIYG